MRIFLPVLCVLCVTPVQSILHGTCPRKDPAPGVVVLSPGSTLVLTCSGHVTVDGVKVSMARNSSNTNRRGRSSDAMSTTANIIGNNIVSMKGDKHTTENAVAEGYSSNPTEAGETRSLGHTDSASPTAQPTRVNRRRKDESDWETEEMDGEVDYEEEEEGGEEGSRVTRSIQSRPKWEWKARIVGKGDRLFTFGRRGASLSLSSVRLTDSGRYTCYKKGRQRFTLKVKVAEPPEIPSLSCYKKSPSSKIRCEWTPQKTLTNLTNCYLLLNKSPSQVFQRLSCSRSSVRCWCALDHNEDELRTLYMAYLCVTNIAGNATSTLLHFMPMSILKPDPPSRVSVLQIEGQGIRMKVTWSLPASWKSQDNYYKLIHELKYKPRASSVYHEQIIKIEDQHSYTITDAMPGVEYLIQLRTREEFEGLWSNWSTPVFATYRKAQTSEAPQNYDLVDTTFPCNAEGSGTDDYGPDEYYPTVPTIPTVPHRILWIAGSFTLLSVILAAYIFRYKDKLMSKLLGLSVVTQHGDSPHPPPSAPAAPEGQALMNSPPHYKEPPPSEVERGVEENEEQQMRERTEAMNFINTSYFLIQH